MRTNPIPPCIPVYQLVTNARNLLTNNESLALDGSQASNIRTTTGENWLTARKRYALPVKHCTPDTALSMKGQ